MFKEISTHTCGYYNKWSFWRNLCWVWTKQQKQHWFSYFQIAFKD